MERAYLQALSVVTQTELRYVAIITTNARHIDVVTNNTSAVAKEINPDLDEEEALDEAIKAELARPYYLCVGKHSLCILDRNMSGDPNRNGYLARIPFRGVIRILTCGSEKDALSISIHRDQAIVPHGCSLPASLYVRSGSTDRIVQQLRICWKADNMYRTLSVKDLPVEKNKNLPGRCDVNLLVCDTHTPAACSIPDNT